MFFEAFEAKSRRGLVEIGREQKTSTPTSNPTGLLLDAYLGASDPTTFLPICSLPAKSQKIWVVSVDPDPLRQE